MKKVILLSAISFFALQGILLAQQTSEPALEERADSLYSAFNEEKALKAYEKILEEQPRDYEALWKTSFLYSRIGNRQEGKDEQQKYFNKAKSLAEQALEVDSTHTQSHFVMSVAMGRMALISGARDRVAASRAIKEHIDLALKADSSNAGAWHVLGRWHFKIANLNFVERLAANILFGGVPGDASNEKAAKAIEKAIELNDSYVLYYHDLAMVHEEMGNKRQAIEACQIALTKENRTLDDSRLKRECEEWIEKWE